MFLHCLVDYLIAGHPVQQSIHSISRMDGKWGCHSLVWRDL